MLLNPPASCAAPFAKGGVSVPSFDKGGLGRISPAVSIMDLPLWVFQVFSMPPMIQIVNENIGVG
jgi:hypothetical protein